MINVKYDNKWHMYTGMPHSKSIIYFKDNPSTCINQVWHCFDTNTVMQLITENMHWSQKWIWCKYMATCESIIKSNVLDTASKFLHGLIKLVIILLSQQQLVTILISRKQRQCPKCRNFSCLCCVWNVIGDDVVINVSFYCIFFL